MDRSRITHLRRQAEHSGVYEEKECRLFSLARKTRLCPHASVTRLQHRGFYQGLLIDRAYGQRQFKKKTFTRMKMLRYEGHFVHRYD